MGFNAARGKVSTGMCQIFGIDFAAQTGSFDSVSYLPASPLIEYSEAPGSPQGNPHLDFFATKILVAHA